MSDRHDEELHEIDRLLGFKGEGHVNQAFRLAVIGHALKNEELLRITSQQVHSLIDSLRHLKEAFDIFEVHSAELAATAEVLCEYGLAQTSSDIPTVVKMRKYK